MYLIIRKEKRYKSITGIMVAILLSVPIALITAALIGMYIDPRSYDVRYVIGSSIIVFLTSFVIFVMKDRIISFDIREMSDNLMRVHKGCVDDMYTVVIDGLPEGYEYYDGYKGYRCFYLSKIVPFIGGKTYNLCDKDEYVGNYSGRLSYEEYRYLARKGEGL